MASTFPTSAKNPVSPECLPLVFHLHYSKLLAFLQPLLLMLPNRNFLVQKAIKIHLQTSRIWYKLSTFPRSLILLMRCGFSLINSLMTSTSGPSPKINNLDFTDFSTLLKISKTSLILFTGRRLET